MARPLRIEYEGALYHVTARGNERRKIYFTKGDYRKFLEYVAEAKERYGIQVHSYVLMSNHYHLIVETPEANLSKAMHDINGSYTTYINKKRERSGHLFQGRYKSIVVDKDSYLVELSRYIHLNPVRAGIVEKPEDYPYSSYRAYVTEENDEVISQELILGMMAGGTRTAKERYRAYVERAIGEELESPLKKVYGGMILGSSRFIKETLKNLRPEHLQKRETSHRMALRSTHRMEGIIDIVSKHFKVTKDEVIEKKNRELRKIAIYLIKKHTSTMNPEIGARFGGLSYSAIAKVVKRFEVQMRDDRGLRKRIEKIEQLMSNVKGRP